MHPRCSRVRRSWPLATYVALVLILASGQARAETGADLWLRYAPIDDATVRAVYARSVTALVVPARSETARLTAGELQRGLKGMLGKAVPVVSSLSDGVVLVATPGSFPAISTLRWTGDLERGGEDGYVIRSAPLDR